MTTRRKAHAEPKHPHRDPNDIELIDHLQHALSEALDQNEIVNKCIFSYVVKLWSWKPC
jgi:hypothetical protein